MRIDEYHAFVLGEVARHAEKLLAEAAAPELVRKPTIIMLETDISVLPDYLLAGLLADVGKQGATGGALAAIALNARMLTRDMPTP